MTNLAQTIPADHITRGVGEPVFPALRQWLTNRPAVLALIDEREAYGVAKYGQTLMTGDDRDTPTEIANEQADALAYIQKYIMQYGFDGGIGDLLLRQIALCDELLAYLNAMSEVNQ